MSADQLPMPEPAGFRMRFRSEPDMIGHYPWTYADSERRRRKYDRPECDYEDLYTADQLRAYGDQRANAALEEAVKLRKLIADHNAECVRMCDSRFAYGPTQCPMRAYNRQCPDCPKDGMVEVPAIKKENGDATN